MEWKNPDYISITHAKKSIRIKEVTNFEIKIKITETKWNSNQIAEKTDKSSFNWDGSQKATTWRTRYERIQAQKKHQTFIEMMKTTNTFYNSISN